MAEKDRGRQFKAGYPIRWRERQIERLFFISLRWTAETVYRKNSSDETLMDEPTSALDPIATTKIEELIYILKKGLHDNNCYSQYAASYQNLWLHSVFMLGEIVEFNDTETLFKELNIKKTEDYITGRFS